MTDKHRSTMPTRTQLYRQAATMAAMLFLGACSYPHARATVAHDSHRHQIAGTASSVVITGVDDRTHAFPFAEQYCEGRGKLARFNQMILYQYSRRDIPSKSAEFNCVMTDGSRPT